MLSSRPERSAVERPPHPAFCTLLLIAAILTTPLHAQPTSTLSDTEVEQVREARYYPSQCILLFIKFLDLRVQELQDLYAHPRRPGREQDTHDLIEQFTAIADELSDNLDDYAPRHADLRKVLPKVLDGDDRWASALRTLPDNDAYNVSCKIALESLRDLRESTNELVPQQDAWFKAHPPAKQQEQQQPEPLTIPR